MKRLAAALLLALLLPAAAHARSLDILEFRARIAVQKSGVVTVTEHVTVRFDGEWNGIYRTIPVDYSARGGMNFRLQLRVVSVTDSAGNELRHDVERTGDSRRIRIWVPGAHDATHTVVLTYRVDNALRWMEHHDELYWNVTGHEWEYPIQRASAEVLLPVEVTGIRTTSFAGAYGAVETANAEQLGNAIHFSTTRPLGLHEGLTVVVGWDRGVVHRPTATEQAAAVFAANALLAMPILAFLLMLALWRRFGRDPDPGSIFVRYDPPADMTPAEAGTLLDDSADMRDVTATLVDLAVRGFIEIHERKEDQLFGLLESMEYELVLLQPERWQELKRHERMLLNSLAACGSGYRVHMSDLENEFYEHLPKITKELSESLVERGVYVRHPFVVRGLWILAAIVAGFAVVAAGLFMRETHGVTVPITFISAFLTCTAIALVGWHMPKRTAEGARMRAWLLGFAEFLARVEKDRLERMDRADTFERFLPWAMAFGVEKKWARAFGDIASEPPRWYHGTGTVFRTDLFAADLGRLTTAAGAAMTSAPRGTAAGSGSSSGFGGGGFSGGGSGGGGGGGF